MHHRARCGCELWELGIAGNSVSESKCDLYRRGFTIARDLLSGFTIALTIRSVDRSLFSHLIVIHSVEGSLSGSTIAFTIRSVDRSLFTRLIPAYGIWCKGKQLS